MFSDNPNWVKGSRLPDLFIYTSAHLEEYHTSHPNWRQEPLRLIPDLVIEVLSLSDRKRDIALKIAAYISDGVPLIWVIDPKKRIVVIYEDEAIPSVILPDSSLLENQTLLPGFSILVRDLFI